MKEKYLMVDSGVLISLTSSCLEPILRFLHEKTGLVLIASKAVEEETINRPIKRSVRKYLFSALRIKNAVEDGLVRVVDEGVEEETKMLLNAANHLFYVRGKPLRLIHFAEAQMVALSRKLDIPYVALDERTMRLLIENALLLKSHIEEEFRVNVMTNRKNFDVVSDVLKGLKVFRSSELVMLAYELGFFRRFHDLEKSAFLSALYRVKYAGCAVSFEEIEDYIRGVDV